uniref:Uncharacterized protein n=1 Tax=Arundo donax TaxID=35708 RepID=A0A0A9BZ30_ARUDO
MYVCNITSLISLVNCIFKHDCVLNIQVFFYSALSFCEFKGIERELQDGS